MKQINVAIVGFGGIAKVHHSAYLSLIREGFPVRLVAVFDLDAAKFSETASINLGNRVEPLSDEVHRYTDLDAMLATEDIDVCDVCLPTFLHKEMTVKLLRAGKHVFVEKPMALNSADCFEMVREAEERGLRLMVGQCLRFDPNYRYLKGLIDGNTYGALRHLRMYRNSEYPHWGAAKWFEQTDKCGGCILDTHIHDIDMARFLLGEPDMVSTVAYAKVPHCELVDTRMFFGGLPVIAECTWDEAQAVSFRAGFEARFERASVIYENDEIRVYEGTAEYFVPELPRYDRVVEELRAICTLAAEPTVQNDMNPPESAAMSVRLVEYIKKSAEAGGATVMAREA
ncbi:MAG: Gfo/Idh/MocA family oxidoreductase [Clostridia bacterium]|nr:Gfo/Idh/MocA family oxidoreductase [Clostridia bacterium]